VRLVPGRPSNRQAPVKVQSAPFGSLNQAVTGTRPILAPAIVSGAYAFAREHFAGPAGQQLNRLQDKISAAIQGVQQLPFAKGQLIQGVSFTATTQIGIQHALGQAWTGYLVLNVQGAGSTFYAVPTPATDGTTIQLVPSATCTGDVWVYV